MFVASEVYYFGILLVMFKIMRNASTAWCSEIDPLRSLDAPELHASLDVRELSLHQAVV